MTPYDELLLWCSEKVEGSIHSLREATRWVALAAGDHRTDLDIMQDLSALAHIEIDWDNSRWWVAPAALCRLPNGGGHRLLTGAHPKALGDALSRLDDSTDDDLAGLAQAMFLVDPVPQRGPASHYVILDEDDHAAAWRTLGIVTVDDPSDGILAALGDDATRAVGTLRTARPGALGATLQLSGQLGSPTWIESVSDSADGCYRYMRLNRPVHAIKRHDTWLELDRAWAVWLSMPRTTPALWAVTSTAELFVSTVERLPTLVERALVLRSGRLPTDHEIGATEHGVGSIAGPLRVKRYVNVSNAVAQRVGDILSKGLRLL